MKLSAPKGIIFLIAVILAAVAFISVIGIVSIPFVSGNAFWFLFAGFVLLMLGNLFKGL